MQGKRWIVFVVVLLLGNVGAVGILIAASGGEGSRQVLPDYYRQAAAWDQHMRADEASAQMGWKAQVSLRRDRIAVALRDSGGQPVVGASVRVSARHRAEARPAFDLVLLPAEPGRYRSAIALPRAGLWEVDVRAHRDDVAWVTRQVVDSEAP